MPRMKLRIREVDEGGGRLTETRASEAKGPFPGGKRVGSWGKKKNKRKGKTKAHGLRSMGLLFLNDERYADPPSTVGGLEGIDKRVGSWGKKK
jgi:hypothetical protein